MVYYQANRSHHELFLWNKVIVFCYSFIGGYDAVWPGKWDLGWFQRFCALTAWANPAFQFHHQQSTIREICSAITAGMQADYNCFPGWGKHKTTLFTVQWFVNNEWQITVFALHQMVGDSRWAAGVGKEWDLSQSIKRRRRHWKSEQQTDRQTWASVTEQKVGLALATLSHSEEYVLYTVSSLHVSIRAFKYMEGEKPFTLTGSSSLSQQWC